MPSTLSKTLAAGPVRAKVKNTKILTLDIETTPNLAWVWGQWGQNISLDQMVEQTRMMCFVAKWYHEDEGMFFGENDMSHEDMVRAAWALLDEADIVVHFNGKTFDMRHLNREFLLLGLTPPSPYREVDLLQVVKRKFRFTSNKLQNIVTQLGIGSKTPHAGFQMWIDCMNRDPKAWKLMRKYNLQDVRVTEMLYDYLRPWIPGHPHLGLFEGFEWGCPNCGHKKLKRNGTVTTALTVYANYVCKKCGKQVRANHRKASVRSREAR